MIDPELQAAVQLLSVLGPPAYFTDFHLFCLIACRMVTIGMQHGMSDASALGFARLGIISGPIFHRYGEGYRFARLACDLVEKHRFIANQPKVYHAMGTVAFWTQPIGTAIDFMRATVRTANETGDLIFAYYGLHYVVHGLLLRNDPLDAVWRESEMALDFVREAKYGKTADIIRSQQRFIATMQGRSATFSTFSDAQFDEIAFEAQLTVDPMPLTICFYWILKLKARFLSGDYAEALAAAEKAKPLLSVATAQIQLLDYYYFAALTVAALFERGSADEQTAWLELLTAHREQLREWADTYPPTFADKHALVSAEIARLDGRDADGMPLYEQAIQSAREHGFVQNEGLAQEVAARFYAARGFETIAHAYLRNARNCYLRWGADGKVRQLDESYPQWREELSPPHPTTTIGASVEHLDLATVIKVSQAVSSEIVPEKVIDTLMRTALEHAGAERGLLILPRGVEQRIEAEATTGSDAIAVRLRRASVTVADLPESVLQHVVRTRESVLLDDASALNPFSADEYIRRNSVRSVLCLPLIKQAKLIGVLYLENNLTPRVFTPPRSAVLKLLASQAALSLENTRLFSDLQEREARIRRFVDSKIIGVISEIGGTLIDANDAFLEMVGYNRDDLVSGRLRWLEMTPPEWLAVSRRAAAQMRATGSCEPFEKEYFRKDGRRVPVLIGAAALEGSPEEGVAFVLDLTERKRAEQALRQAQADLAHVNRVTTMGELTASLSHEVKQPIAAAVTDANTCVLWLAHDPPNVDEARAAAMRVVEGGRRATAIISRMRLPFTKGRPEREPVDVNELIREMTVLLRGEAMRYRVLIRTALAADLPPVMADRVQLQQVLMNLIMNSIDAMKAVEGTRDLAITSQRGEGTELEVSVSDTGVGLPPQQADQIFKAFFTTKNEGLGMGLSISRSIVESHGGRLSATDHTPRGATFCVTLPTRVEGQE
jgi:PAS domain S-box-containing protein